MTDQAPDGRYEVEALKVRRSLEAEGRSETLLRLFDYLLAHSHDIRAPKEIEIAFEVFGKDVRYDTSQNAMVRVYVHRLRGRLDEIYQGSHASRLTIPKGEYRIILAEGPPPALQAAEENAAGRSLKRLAIVAGVVTALGWGILFNLRDRSGVWIGSAVSSFHNAEDRCGVPLLVMGDSYLFLQSRPGDHSTRLVMRPAIGSAAQLDSIQSDENASVGQVRDPDRYYMSASGAEGLWSLLATLSAPEHRNGTVPKVLPISKLTPEVLNGGDIIYFGRLDQLAPLREVVFQASRFTFDPISDTLHDPGSRRDFTAQLTEAIDENVRNPLSRPAFAYDYGYLARITKPNGCAVWIIAGLQDSALPQMARIAGDSSQLDVLLRQSRGAPSFEALYEIRSLGALRYRSRLTLVRALESAE